MKMLRGAVLASVVLMLACGGRAPRETKPEAEEQAEASKGIPRCGMQLASLAFNDGQPIPQKHTADGENVSPALEWTDVPEGVKSFALVCRDPDAPRGTFIHWVVFNVPDTVRMLAEGVKLAEPAVEAREWFGPSPPPGKPHRYFFALYALDTVLGPELVSAAELEQAMEGHILGMAELMGTYQR